MPHKTNESIAVIGSACRFAGDASSPSKLEELLRNPRQLLREIPEDRFNAQGFYHPNGALPGHTNVKHAYFLDGDPATFDAEFFGIKPVEAKAIDPQQRMLMEVAYEALEAAGLTISKMRGSDTAVYVGCMVKDYSSQLLRDLQGSPTYVATGTAASILSNRLSYFFDWHGPSVTLDTACSSSLAAVHLAAQALREGDSRTALASGSNLILGPDNFIIESKLKMLSPEGQCRMWDQDANGYGRGEGVATLVLKTLSAALEDGDHIECLIRETALNQDGATTGITMPSSSAQESLIHTTYAKAGLDLRSQNDRPQYFEAHGTGTPAGDPQEAEAIYKVFYGSAQGGSELNGGNPLYVGSVKTVLGHTEGTAGVAGILKASLAMQRGFVPPNLLFDQLSDRVAPFYKNLEILKAAKPWPQTLDGRKRASVNSFGFGGANAHAIIESYEQSEASSSSASSDTLFAPFTFSAFSESSLRATLAAYVNFLEDDHPNVNVRDLAWTLRERRSAFPYRTTFAASSKEDLRAAILAQLSTENSSIGVKSLVTSKKTTPRILGIFTGQGAQYARMGAELIEQSDMARRVIEDLELSLGQLPDGPSWSLKAEILVGDTSRVHEAAISQPLCTAIQILLVRILEEAGVDLAAVVGHSSGEIAAAYAAGYLTAQDAIRVAYYRGLHLKLASSPNGPEIQGAMLAVGSSMEDMQDICADQEFAGRICIAASNSPSSVTMSGDENAIAELQLILDDEKKFNRRLKVDKAYHSSHMLPCFDPYVASLRRCGITSQPPRENCTWISSVHNRVADESMELSDTYWAANMTQPVLFSEALTTALSFSHYDLGLEVGPHPALKGPATQNIQSLLNKDIPYHGLLQRGTSAKEAVAKGLAYLWSNLDASCVNLDAYEKAMIGDEHHYCVVKNLPTYQWTHDTKYWHESRGLRKTRLRSRPFHSLLGDMCPDSAPHHMSWKNLLQTGSMEWLSGHRVQGQVVFPASGYLTSALEAARVIAESSAKQIRLVEVKNFTIHQAVVFSDEDASVEVLIEMGQIHQEPNRIRAQFTYSAALSPQADNLSLAASCAVDITLGEPSISLLPAHKSNLTHMVDVEPDRFYTALADMGYMFSDRFRSLSSLRRKYHKATCLARMRALQDDEEDFLIHPAELDSFLQSTLLAYSYPNDDQLRLLHLPTSIDLIRFNPALLGGSHRTQDEFLPVDATIAPRDYKHWGITGHLNIYSDQSPHAAVQVQGGHFMPLGGATAQEERRIFSKVHWVNTQPDGDEAARDIDINEHHIEMMLVTERIAAFYLRKFERDIPSDSPLRSEFPTNWYLNYARYITGMVESGKHKWARDEWLNDTIEDVMEVSKPFSESPDVQIMHLVGAQMPRVFNGETTMLEQFRSNDILDRYYQDGFGLHQCAAWVGRSVKQITDCSPHLNILEVGAGTGGATKAIFREIGSSFNSYTYTDISAAFFENAASNFSQNKDKMAFKTFDAEKDPVSQGYVEHSYDLIVAFFVIHATSDLEKSFRNIRRLLKPGGRLVVGEGLEDHNGVASSGFVFGTLPGWWLGTETGRTISPHVSPKEWDEILRKSGFSGLDTTAPHGFEDVFNVCLFSSQAVDDQVDYLRKPLASPQTLPNPITKLVLVGGQTDRSSYLVAGLKSILEGSFATSVHLFDTLESVDYEVVDGDSTVVCLTELDRPVFNDITPTAFTALKRMFESKKSLLWITSGRLDDEPFSNMVVGFGRTAEHETPDLRLQHLDIAKPETTNPQIIAEILLRFHESAFHEDSAQWTVEPELVIDEAGRQMVARLRPIDDVNDRYNSGRQPIVREKNITEHPLAVEPSASGCTIKELSRYALSTLGRAESDTIEVQITASVHSALMTSVGPKFLVRCIQAGTSTNYLALLDSLSSVAKVSPKSMVQLHPDELLRSEEMVSMTAAHFVAAAILENVFEGEAVLVHNALSTISQVLERRATTKGVQIVFTTDRTDKEVPSSWIQLPRFISQADLDEISLVKPKVFVGLSNHGTETSENEVILMANLPIHCRKMTFVDLFSTSGCPTSISGEEKLGEILRNAVRCVRQDISALDDTAEFSKAVPLKTLAAGEVPIDPIAIVDWTTTDKLPISIRRLDAERMFKCAGSTYWIVGMTGALGLSLADWMISRGATSVVLTSRNPQISPEWLESHKRKGATVAVFPCDVSNEVSLKEVHRQICDTLPPIAGVMNGAMVLRDTSIRNMSFDELMTVLRPKVNGSIYLDRIFHDVDLDFFVLVSSINCVIGNMGQANYAAANMFMCALAGQRRKRGLRAATVNGGAIIGAGYLENSDRRGLDMIVEKLSILRLSEEDWTQTICEAIDASRRESPHGPEITVGLAEAPIDSPNVPYWFNNPKFGDFIVRRKASSGDDDGKGKAAASVQERLQSCSSLQQLQEVVEDALANQLRNVLQTSSSNEELMASTGTEIGLDSLVSVDIRSWFLKNLQVNIPVLKIMSNDTIGSLVELAVDSIPGELIPQMDDSSGSSGTESPTSGEGESVTSFLTPHPPASTNATTPARTPPPETNMRNSKRGEEIDWDAESCPPADFASIQRLPGPSPSNPPNVIVLTGVSGLLGRHLLNHFLEHTKARKIVCLAIRRLASRLEKGELLPHPRVEYHEGDLVQPLLGLSPQDAESIFAEADVVIHNGSDTSHLKYFRDLRCANVGSTIELLRLCLPRRVPIHFISSTGVSVLANQPQLPPISVTGPGFRRPAPDGVFGYMCSKWVNERLLEQVQNEYGLPVCIHRPSTIIREGDDATDSRAELDWVHALLTSARKIQAVPKVEHNQGVLDLVYLQSVCADIVSHMLDKSERAQNEVTYVHEVGDRVIPLHSLQDLGKNEGISFEVVAIDEFMRRALAAGLHPAVAALIEVLDSPGMPVYPRLLKA